jgi:hypothetical protein
MPNFRPVIKMRENSKSIILLWPTHGESKPGCNEEATAVNGKMEFTFIKN